MPKKSSPTDAALAELRAFGLGYPGAHTKSPWPGHLDLAVKDKTFAYLSVEGEPFSISCKLPSSGAAALMLPNTKPTGYGLGKSGWVSATFPDGNVPVAMLKEWIAESYRAQAPKALVASLEARTAASSPATTHLGRSSPSCSSGRAGTAPGMAVHKPSFPRGRAASRTRSA
jgi:predicted DNA-binding protein (MmcQ/YjbR family)